MDILCSTTACCFVSVSYKHGDKLFLKITRFLKILQYQMEVFYFNCFWLLGWHLHIQLLHIEHVSCICLVTSAILLTKIHQFAKLHDWQFQKTIQIVLDFGSQNFHAGSLYITSLQLSMIALVIQSLSHTLMDFFFFLISSTGTS